MTTVNGAQGREWDFVIVDLVVTDNNNLGFLQDIRHQCVMLTRAKFVQWIVGPDLSEPPRSPYKEQPIDDNIEFIVKQPMSSANFKAMLAHKTAVTTLSDIRHPE